MKSANFIFLKLTWHKLQQQRSVAGIWNRGQVGHPSCCFSSLPWDSNCLLLLVLAGAGGCLWCQLLLLGKGQHSSSRMGGSGGFCSEGRSCCMWEQGFHAHEGACLHMGEEGGVNRGFYMCDEENRPTEQLNLNAFNVAQ